MILVVWMREGAVELVLLVKIVEVVGVEVVG
jgi:hypothetical protein